MQQHRPAYKEVNMSEVITKRAQKQRRIFFILKDQFFT